ncbi:MAG: hypothetical protein JNL54_11850 [Kineosporiaceae bacterium]|nr:hypothetical protein [Kineosporiaceae bacterium]
MTMLHGVVVVLPAGSLEPNSIPAALADLVDPDPHEAAGSRWWDVVGLSDGTLLQQRHPAGVDVLTVTYAGNEDHRSGQPGVRFRTDLLVRCARDLGARYGFASRYPDRWQEPLLTSETIAPLEVRDWAVLRAAPHEAWLFGAERPDPLVGGHVLSGSWGAVLGIPAAGEPPHRVLVPPPGWTVSFMNLTQQEPDDLGPGDDWFWFLEDIAYYRRNDGVGVDIGWYPDQNPAGRFRVEHVDDTWRRLSPSLETRSLDEVVRHVERLWQR